MESRRRRRLLSKQTDSPTLKKPDSEPHDDKSQEPDLILPSSTSNVGLKYRKAMSMSSHQVDVEPHDDKYLLQEPNLISPSSTPKFDLKYKEAISMSSHRRQHGYEQSQRTSNPRLVSPPTKDSPSLFFSTDMNNNISGSGAPEKDQNHDNESSSFLETFHHDLSSSIDQSVHTSHHSSSQEQKNRFLDNSNNKHFSSARGKLFGKADIDEPFDIESTDSSLRHKFTPRKGGNKPFDEITYDVDKINHLNASLMRQKQEKQEKHQSTYSNDRKGKSKNQVPKVEEEEAYERMYRSNSEDEGDNGRKRVHSLPPIRFRSRSENPNTPNKNSFLVKKPLKEDDSSFDTNSSYGDNPTYNAHVSSEKMTSHESDDVFIKSKSFDNGFNESSLGIDTTGELDSSYDYDPKNDPIHSDKRKSKSWEQDFKLDFHNKSTPSSSNFDTDCVNRVQSSTREESEAEPPLYSYSELVNNNLDEVKDSKKINQYTPISTAGGWDKNETGLDTSTEVYDEIESWHEAEEQWKQAERAEKDHRLSTSMREITNNSSFEENITQTSANEGRNMKNTDSILRIGRYDSDQRKTLSDSVCSVPMDESQSSGIIDSPEAKLDISNVSELTTEINCMDDESLLNLAMDDLNVERKNYQKLSKDEEHPKTRKKYHKQRRKGTSKSRNRKQNNIRDIDKLNGNISHEENDGVDLGNIDDNEIKSKLLTQRKEDTISSDLIGDNLSQNETEIETENVNTVGVSTLKEEIKVHPSNSKEITGRNELRISNKIKLKGTNQSEAVQRTSSVAFAHANKNTIHEFEPDDVSFYSEDDATEITSVTDASYDISVCDSYDGRSMHSDYTKSYESEAEDMVKDFLFIGSGKSTNPGKRQLKYRYSRKKVYRERKKIRKKKGMNRKGSESGDTINIVTDKIIDGETETKIRGGKTMPKIDSASDKSLKKQNSSHSKSHGSNSAKNEFDVPDPLSFVWSYVEDGLNAVNTALGFSLSPDEEKKDIDNKNKKSVMDFAACFVDENGPFKCEDYDQVTSAGSHDLASTDTRGNFETDNELANGLYKAAVCSAENKHLLLGLTFDRSVDIDVVEEIKFVMVAIRSPLGICFGENAAGCWISNIKVKGNAAKILDENKVEVGDQLASINGINALEKTVNEIDALLSSMAKKQKIELTFLRFIGRLNGFQRQSSEDQNIKTCKSNESTSSKDKLKFFDSAPSSPIEKVKNWASPRRRTNSDIEVQDLKVSEVVSSENDGKAQKSKKKFSLFKRGKKNKQ